MHLLCMMNKRSMHALWQPARQLHCTGSFVRFRHFLQIWAEACIQAGGGHFEHSLWAWTDHSNSVIKHFRTHVVMDVFPSPCMRNPFLKFCRWISYILYNIDSWTLFVYCKLNAWNRHPNHPHPFVEAMLSSESYNWNKIYLLIKLLNSVVEWVDCLPSTVEIPGSKFGHSMWSSLWTKRSGKWGFSVFWKYFNYKKLNSK